MTTPTNRPADDELEDRLRAAYERAMALAEDDLADGLLAAEAIDRGRRRQRGGEVWRTGLVLAAAAFLGLGTLWAIGGRITPSPAPAASLALAGSASPTSAAPGGSVAPIQSSSGEATPEPTGWVGPSGSPVPDLPVGDPWPTAIDGQPIYAIGGSAEQHIAQATDDTPFLVSGWLLQMGGNGSAACNDFSLGSPAPDGVYFRDCAGSPLYAGPSGGASVAYFFAVVNGVGAALAETAPIERTQVRHEIVRVHLHDRGCSAADCATKPVLDEILLTGETRLNPVIVAASLPPNGVSMQDAIATALETVRQGYGAGYPHVVSVTLGTAAVLGDLSGSAVGNPASTWEWKIVASTDDGQSVATAYVDYLTGVCTRWGATGNGSLSR